MEILNVKASFKIGEDHRLDENNEDYLFYSFIDIFQRFSTGYIYISLVRPHHRKCEFVTF